VLNLLSDLQEQLRLTYLLIAHDLAVVEHMADSVAVMYLGTIAELGPPAELMQHPAHPYTQALLSAIPVPDPASTRARLPLRGEIPSPMHPPPGCSFHTRCPFAMDRCRSEVPLAREVAPGHIAACHLLD
jgi:oligopeptide/dipeptide ABC transporter ATP-binding protein